MRTAILCVSMLSSLAWAQNQAMRDCQENVADALGIATGNVAAQVAGNGDNGNPVVEWEANLSGRRIRGFCETNRNGRVTTTQLGRFNGGNGGGSIFDPGGGFGGGGNKGGGNKGGGTGGAAISMKVDTSGNGTFTGMGQSVRITRGWVDTTSTPSVSLSGQGDFKITFYGAVTGSGQNREFTIRINRSDRGAASGTATVRMNANRDEVEYINIEGRVGRDDVRGTFNRN